MPRPYLPDLYAINVFINCPFSSEYKYIFKAIVFAVYACGYRPRCALEINDSSVDRLAKIERMIQGSQFGIHDISFVELDEKTKLPRFNMPFELGMFFGAKRFGAGRQKKKIALIIDKRGYRYRDSLSDISGRDIQVHGGIAKTAICKIRDWLSASRGLPGGNYINKHYNRFSRRLPAASKELELTPGELTYPDLCRAIEGYIEVVSTAE